MKTIILADDNKDFNMMCQRFLTNDNASLKVISTFTGKETIEKYKELQPDILILDYQLPDIDGIKVLKELEDFEKEHPKQNVIFITGEDTINSELFSMEKVYNSLKKMDSFENIKEEVYRLLDEIRINQKQEKKEIADFLSLLGVKDYKSNNYKYLICSIQLVLGNIELLDNMQPAYNLISKKYNRSSKHVERRIYYNVKSIKNMMPKDKLKELFSVYSEYDKFTTRSFLDMTYVYFEEKSILETEKSTS